MHHDLLDVEVANKGQ